MTAWGLRFERPRRARFAALVITVLLLLVAIAELELVTRALRSGTTTAIGIDVNQYLVHTRRWLDGGSWYVPQQLAGPYVIEPIDGNVYPPSLLYLTVPFALGVPMVFWYLVPVGIVVFTYWRRPPAWWAWPLVGLVLVYPRTWTLLLLGNPGMWAIAACVAGVASGWLAIGATIKLIFAPFMLIGIRRRSWWAGLAVATVLAVPFGSLWLDYATVIMNTRSSRGLEYPLGELPIVILLVIAAGSHRVPVEQDQAAGGMAPVYRL